jgi:hypothetical protein
MTASGAPAAEPARTASMDAVASPPRHVKHKRAKPASPAQLHVQQRFADFGREASIAAGDLSGFKYISKGEGRMHAWPPRPARGGPQAGATRALGVPEGHKAFATVLPPEQRRNCRHGAAVVGPTNGPARRPRFAAGPTATLQMRLRHAP